MRTDTRVLRGASRTLPVTSCDLGAATGINVSHLPCRTPCYVSVVVSDSDIAARAFWTNPCTHNLECVGELTHAQLRNLVMLATLQPELPPLASKEY